MTANYTVRRRELRSPPSQIEYKTMKFLITDRPTDHSIHNYIAELKKHQVRLVVRLCEPSYNLETLYNEGILVTDLVFDDGSPPPSSVVHEWFELLKASFLETADTCVAVHCVAGLGRAPVMVALALIELGMKYEDAVEFIRLKRRGAINSKQLTYLEMYRPNSRLKLRKAHNHGCCIFYRA